MPEGLEFKKATGRNHPQDSYNNEETNVAKLYELYERANLTNKCGGVGAYRRSATIDGIGISSGANDSVLGYAAGWGPPGSKCAHVRASEHY